jgi:cobalt-zinc-cadmium efflux system outer membrane protein
MKPLIHLVALSIGCIHLLALADGATAAPAQDAAGRALTILPPEPVVRRVLESLPQLRLGTANMDLASAEKAKLVAGPHEWTIRGGINQRRIAGGDRYNEQDVALERPLRWFGKADKDKAVGDKGVELARAMHADVWHETGRTLMKDWFDALRELTAAARLREQLDVTGQLRAVAERRAKAGDGAALDALQATTEQLRVEALLQQAQQRQDQSLAFLEISYPGLPRPSPDNLPLPQAVLESPQFWLAKILHDNHELELAQAEADLYALRASRAASEKMPDPTIALRATRERAGQERVIGVSLSIPLPGAGRAADGMAAALRQRMAMERLAQVRMRVQSAAQRAVIDSARTYQIWETLRDVETQSARQADLMLRAYQAGECPLAEALGARRRALDASLVAQGAQIDALAAFARLRLDAHAIWSID